MIMTMEVSVLPSANKSFVEWQSKFNSKLAAFPGFVSLEFLSPTQQQSHWLIVERFSNEESLARWRDSLIRNQLMDELKKLAASDGIREISMKESELQGGVTEIFVTEVHAEKDQAYRDWAAKIHQAEASFPGFRGVYVQSPKERGEGHWITLLQFDTRENLDNWLKSPERNELLKESSVLISSMESHRVISPYAGWFASIAKVGVLPPVWKQTMLVLLVLFPIVMLELKYLSPLTAGLNFSLGTFIANAISVSLISFPMMPIALYFLGWWLLPDSRKRLQWTIFGAAIVIVLYLLEIAFFWFFY